MDQVEAPHDWSNLSPLQVPDKMPLGQLPRSPSILGSASWRWLSEDRQSSCYSLADLVEPHRFGRRDEARTPLRPSRLLSRMPDPLEHEPNILTD
jgi:hypothetical protein